MGRFQTIRKGPCRMFRTCLACCRCHWCPQFSTAARVSPSAAVSSAPAGVQGHVCMCDLAGQRASPVSVSSWISTAPLFFSYAIQSQVGTYMLDAVCVGPKSGMCFCISGMQCGRDQGGIGAWWSWSPPWSPSAVVREKVTNSSWGRGGSWSGRGGSGRSGVGMRAGAECSRWILVCIEMLFQCGIFTAE